MEMTVKVRIIVAGVFCYYIISNKPGVRDITRHTGHHSQTADSTRTDGH